MSATRIAIVTDSHLAERAPECIANWHAAAAAAAALAPALGLHLGDISLDGERHPAELGEAARLLAAWPTPLHCLPGNHDLGTGSGEEPLDPRRRAAHLAAFGADHWVLRVGRWHLIGLDAQLFGTGGEAEAAQWSMLDDAAARLARRDRVVLLSHRPLQPAPGDPMRAGRYVPAEAARRLIDGPLRPALRLVLSGHTHQALDFADDSGLRHVWVPSCAFVIPDTLQAAVGRKDVGLGVLTLDGEQAHYAPCWPTALQRHELDRLAFWRDERG